MSLLLHIHGYLSFFFLYALDWPRSHAAELLHVDLIVLLMFMCHRMTPNTFATALYKLNEVGLQLIS